MRQPKVPPQSTIEAGEAHVGVARGGGDDGVEAGDAGVEAGDTLGFVFLVHEHADEGRRRGLRAGSRLSSCLCSGLVVMIGCSALVVMIGCSALLEALHVVQELWKVVRLDRSGSGGVCRGGGGGRTGPECAA